MKNPILDQFGSTDKIWTDKKHYFGLPISFTEYSLSNDRVFVKTGFFNEKRSETLLYRIKDISIRIGFFQRLFGVGTIVLETLDSTTPKLILSNVKRPERVKEMLHSYVETAKRGASIEQIFG